MKLKNSETKNFTALRKGNKMKKLVVSVLGVAGLCMLGTAVEANELKQQGLFNALHAEEQVATRGQSISDLVASLVDKSNEERFSAVNQYIQANDLTTNRFINLMEALTVLGMDNRNSDKLVGAYAGKREGKFTFESLTSIMELLSNHAYSTANADHNVASQVAELSIKNRGLTWDNFRKLLRMMDKQSMDSALKDSKVLIPYVSSQGGKLEIGNLKSLLGWTNHHHTGVQSRAMLVEEYIRKNAHKLTKPEFRDAIVSIQGGVAKGQGVYMASGLDNEVQDKLYLVEYKFFGSLFYGVGSVVETIKEQVPDTSWKAVIDLFVERNSHRLKDSHIKKLRAAFE